MTDGKSAPLTAGSLAAKRKIEYNVRDLAVSGRTPFNPDPIVDQLSLEFDKDRQGIKPAIVIGGWSEDGHTYPELDSNGRKPVSNYKTIVSEPYTNQGVADYSVTFTKAVKLSWGYIVPSAAALIRIRILDPSNNACYLLGSKAAGTFLAYPENEGGAGVARRDGGALIPAGWKLNFNTALGTLSCAYAAEEIES